MSVRKHIVCDAIPFGYGPARILQKVLDLLGDGFKITLLANGSTLEYFSTYPISFVECNSYDEAELLQQLRSFDRVDLVISVENERMIRAANAAGQKTLFISLFEFIWESPLEALPEDTLVAVYRMLEQDEEIERAKKKYSKVAIVSGFDSSEPMSHSFDCERDFSLVHIGGLNSKHITQGHQSTYLLFVIPALALAGRNLEKCLIVTNPQVVAASRHSKFVRGKKARVVSLTFQQYQHELLSCGELITTPGISSVVDAVQQGKLTHLLLPANFTQVHQLQQFNRIFRTKYPSFSDLSENYNVQAGASESCCNNQINHWIDAVANDIAALRTYSILFSRASGPDQFEIRVRQAKGLREWQKDVSENSESIASIAGRLLDPNT